MKTYDRDQLLRQEPENRRIHAKLDLNKLNSSRDVNAWLKV